MKQKNNKTPVERNEIPLVWILAIILLVIAIAVVLAGGPERVFPVISTPTPTLLPMLPAATAVPTPVSTPTPTPQPAVSTPPFAGTIVRECGVIARSGNYQLVTDLYVSEVGNDFSCITVDAPGVVFDCGHHSITGSGKGNAILLRKSNNAVVKNCVAKGFKYGINVGSQSNVIEDNEFSENNEGIWLWSSSGNVIRNNLAKDNYDYGLMVGGGSFNNVVLGNELTTNGLGGAGGGIYENTESRPNNTYSSNSVCGNGHDLVCDAGNMIDGGANHCSSPDSCNVACLPC
ncbi:right-handed parallel beta-helix repeat-containing protein [Candidatus Micrarchaeota archaeon]|nr:right-handed parallel beta-helix repeat-containing protein [Candidatus Micrarchaeota archaeon]